MKNEILNLEKKTVLDRIDTVYLFYRDGFREMVLGKKLWTIILIKLFVMFAILKLFFFPNYLNSNFQTNEEKTSHVLDQMTRNTSANRLK